jgi:hypothetical protein
MVSSSLIRKLSQAVDEVEKRLKPSRAWKVVNVPRGWEEHPDTALERHYAAHPEDRGADIVIFKFCEIENKD